MNESNNGLHTQIYLYLQLHDVPTSWRSYQASAYAVIELGERADIPWLFIMINDLQAEVHTISVWLTGRLSSSSYDCGTKIL